MNTETPSLPTGCGLCNKKDDLKRCSRCKAIRYCSREHQTEHRDAHKKACNEVYLWQQATDKEEHKLRNGPPDAFFQPQNPFETHVGHFWGLPDNRDYMRARFSIVEALYEINTRLSVETQLDPIMDMLRLSRGDNMGVRYIAPGLMLQLGRDQECYDFLKWQEKTYRDSDYDWGDMDAPYLNIKNANSLESADLFWGKHPQLRNLVPVTILKIRLLLDFLCLRQSEVSEVASRVPREVLGIIQGHTLQTNIVAGQKELRDSEKSDGYVDMLCKQITNLYSTIEVANANAWTLLLTASSEDLNARPSHHSAGSIEEAQLVLQYNYRALRNTQGAQEIVTVLEEEGTIKI